MRLLDYSRPIQNSIHKKLRAIAEVLSQPEPLENKIILSWTPAILRVNDGANARGRQENATLILI
jgi:hypothetical protein